jgi:hypothetical protein
MRLFGKKKKRGLVTFEAPINYYVNENNEVLFKGKDFLNFLLEYEKRFIEQGFTKKNNDGYAVLNLFIEQFSELKNIENEIADKNNNAG